MADAKYKNIISTINEIIFPHKYKFENIRDAIKYNTSILKKNRYDFTRPLTKEKGTMLELGSEFRTIDKLHTLLSEREH